MSQRRAVAVVKTNERLGDSVHVLSLDAPGWAADAAPGQFAMLRCPGAEPLLARPMAFMTADAQGASFGIKVSGRGTAALAAAGQGTELIVWGPLGIGFSAAPAATKTILVGGGIGVPPLVLQATARARAGVLPHAVIVGARSKGELFGREEFRRAGIAPQICTDDGSEGHKGFVTALLAKEALGPDTLIQACGPTPMLIAVAKIAREANARCELSLEARMGCGVGACRGCMVPVADEEKAATGRFPGREYLCLCLDGPVVDAASVDLVKLGNIH